MEKVPMRSPTLSEKNSPISVGDNPQHWVFLEAP